MAIAFDTSGAARVNTIGATSTVNLTAAETAELAIIFTWNGATGTPTLTVGGNAATQIGTGITFSGTQVIRAWYYVNPPTSSTAYSGTLAGDKTEIHALLYKGASQTGIPDSYATLDTPSSNPFTISTTVVLTNSWLVSMARDYTSGAQTAGTGTTLRQAGIGASSGDSNGTVGTGSRSMGWTPASAGEGVAGFIVSIAPASATVNSNFFAFM